MLLSEIFDQLIYGDLNDLALVEDGCIKPSDYPLIINAVNMGLTELHKRLPLKVKEVILQQYEQISTYTIHSKYAQTNTSSTEPIKYIVDSEFEPFVDDLLAIEAVFTEEGEEYYLNDENSVYSIFTPSWNQIQFPYPDNDNAFSVIYRANHRKIDTGIVDLDEEVEIPSSLLEPLLLYVSYRLRDSKDKLNGTNNSINILNKFEISLAQIEQAGLITQGVSTNYNLTNNGWV